MKRSAVVLADAASTAQHRLLHLTGTRGSAVTVEAIVEVITDAGASSFDVRASISRADPST